MAYKTIDETFWTDPVNKKGLTFKDKLLFLYLITNPHTHYSGIYYLPKVFIVDETGVSIKDINLFLKNNEKVKYDELTEIIWVVNMAKHQMRQGNMVNLLKGIAKHLTTLHNTVLIKDFLETYKHLDIPIRNPFVWDTQPIPESVSVSVSVSGTGTGTESGTEGGSPPIFTQVVDYLNMKLGTAYKSASKKTQGLVKARQGEGFVFVDFKKVIDGRVALWKNDPKMSDFLRPETLFGTKFEGYLNKPEISQMRGTDKTRGNWTLLEERKKERASRAEE